MAGVNNKNAIWTLLLFLLALITTFQQDYYNNQPVVTPNEMDGLYCLHDKPLNDPLRFLSAGFVPTTGIFLAKAVHLVLGSSYLSARKILVPGRF